MTAQTRKHATKGTALITGASSGIGAVYADRLARRGYDLILVARRRDRLDTLAALIAADTGRHAEVLVADLAVKADLLALEQRLQSDPSISVLVNNAGFGAATPLVESDPDLLEAMIQLNVTALTRLTRAAAPAFVRRGSGTIINIASIVAVAPELLNGTYSGSKAYVVNFTQSLHHELSAKGIQVQAVLPGATRTEFRDVLGYPVHNLKDETVMSAGDLVDAALAALDQHELITIPSLPDPQHWETLNSARVALGPYLSRKEAAQRYKH